MSGSGLAGARFRAGFAKQWPALRRAFGRKSSSPDQ
jgi:hypothetical protein